MGFEFLQALLESHKISPQRTTALIPPGKRWPLLLTRRRQDPYLCRVSMGTMLSISDSQRSLQQCPSFQSSKPRFRTSKRSCRDSQMSQQKLSPIDGIPNERQRTSMLLLDCKQAFDRVWNEGLIFELNELVCPRYLVGLIKLFIPDRFFRVRKAKSCLLHSQ